MESTQEVNQSYHPVPQPDDISIREKEDAMGAYLMMFAAMGAGLPLPIINLIAIIIYYYLNKSASLFVRFHTYQALISQVPTTLMNAVAVFWGIRVAFFDDWFFTDALKGYLALVIVANIIYFILGIVGAVKARKGMMYYYFFFGKIAYDKVFRIKHTPETKIMNAPPKL